MDKRPIGRREFLISMAAAGLGLFAGGWLGRRWLDAPATSPEETVAPVGLAASGLPGVINILDCGADPTGASDSSDAFAKALGRLERAVRGAPPGAAWSDGNRRGGAMLYVPAGRYVVTRPEALMRGSFRTRTYGLRIQGAGRGATQIVFRNRKAGQYLLYNNDAWLGLTIADIEFSSDDPANNFMYSYSRGGAQNYTFERCLWSGSWNRLFHLKGTNTNSEMTWFHCNFNGIVQAGVYVPEDGGSDQFQNYNFFACQFEVSEGDFLVFGKGGNINVWGGSLIHSDTSKGGTFFRLLGSTHGYGVQRFLCIGTRFELRSPSSRLIECEWGSGTVSFISCDMSSQAYRLESAVQATFSSINEKMPVVKFDGCLLAGRHEYRYLVQSWEAPHQVVYENCEFVQAASADAFIVYSADAGNRNDAGRPLVVFRNCRSAKSGSEGALFDAATGMRTGNRALLAPKLASIKDAEGSMPAGGKAETFRLPVGAVVLNVKFIGRPAAASAGGTADYWIETADDPPRRIASVYAASAADGFRQSEDVLHECADEASATLRLRAGAGVRYPNREALCLIEYIG